MKTLVSALALALSIFSSSAQAAQKETPVELTGVVQARQTATVVCMAMGCPPSLPYFEGVLVLENGEELPMPNLQSEMNVTVVPEFLTQGAVLAPIGAKVLVKGTLMELTSIQYRYLTSIEELTVLN